MWSSPITLASYKYNSPTNDKPNYADILNDLTKNMKDGIDIICLQGINSDLVKMIIANLEELPTSTSRYWLVLNPLKYGMGVIINVTKFSYRPIFYAEKDNVQTLLIHEHSTSKVFYLANLNDTNSTAFQHIMDTFQNYSKEQKATILVGHYDAIKQNTLKLTTKSNKNIIHTSDFTTKITKIINNKTYDRYDCELELKGTGVHAFLG